MRLQWNRIERHKAVNDFLGFARGAKRPMSGPPYETMVKSLRSERRIARTSSWVCAESPSRNANGHAIFKLRNNFVFCDSLISHFYLLLLLGELGVFFGHECIAGLVGHQRG